MGEAPSGQRRLVMLAALLAAACVAGIWFTSPVIQIVAGAVAMGVAVRLAVQTFRHLRVARALAEGSVAGATAGVPLRWRAFASGAAVAGLRRPRIYCDPRLSDELTSDELTAVVLHERFHQLRRDPLRLLALSAVEPLLVVTAAGRDWVTRQRARLEVDADRFAVRHGADRADLAAAILKVGGAQPVAAAAGFTSAVELRLRALLEADGPHVDHHEPANGQRALIVATFAVAAACAAAAAHHLLAIGGDIGCALAGC